MTGSDRPTTRYIRVGDLKIPTEYQRDFNPAKGRRLSKNWDESVVGELFVSEREDGSLWVIEGQHRWWAAGARFGPNKKLKCAVFQGLSIADEANMFTKINEDRTPIPAYDSFKAKVTGQQEQQMAIAQVLERLDLKTAKSSGPNRVGGIRALERIYDSAGPDVLYQTLEIVLEAWGREKASYDADIIQAIARLLELQPNLDKRVLAKRLSKDGRKPVAVDDWKREGTALARGGSRSRSTTIARLMAERYDQMRGITAEKKINFPWA